MLLAMALMGNFGWGQIAGIRSSGSWDMYILEIREEVALISLNMELYPHTPAPNLPFIMIISEDFGNCVDGDFPNNETLDAFDVSFARIVEGISKTTEGEWVSTLVHGCRKFEYLYISDTTGLRELWEGDLKNLEGVSRMELDLKEDSEWGYYRTFLYPNEFYQESMANQKVILALLEAGDDLSQERKVEHRLYFPDKKGMNACLKILEKEGFSVAGKPTKKDRELPYGLAVHRTDFVTLNEINPITLNLRKRAEEFGGKYDGWETFVVK